MSDHDRSDEQSGLSRRNVLLTTTALAAVSAVSSAAAIQITLAQGPTDDLWPQTEHPCDLG